MKRAIRALRVIGIILLFFNTHDSFSQNINEGTEQSNSFHSDTTLVNEYIVKAEKLNEEAQYDSSTFYYNKAIELIEKMIVNYDDKKLWEKYIYCYNGVGENYIAKAEYDLALEKTQIALTKGIDHLGAYHPEVATSYNNIGGVYMLTGQYDKSLEFFQKSLNIKLKTQGENRIELSYSYNNIGMVYYRKGIYNEAIENFQKSLEIRLNTLGDMHPNLANVYNNMGLVFDRRGHYKKAKEYYKKTLVILLNAFGKDHPYVATTYNNIGMVFYNEGDYEKALEYIHECLNSRRTALGENNSSVAQTYNNIGVVLDSKGDYVEALEYHKKSLNVWLNTLGEYHPDVARSYNNIGVVYSRKGNYDKALEYYQKSLDIRFKSLRENHPDFAESYNNMGTVNAKKEHYTKALEYYQKSLNIKIEALGENDPDVALSYNNIAGVYSQIGDYDKALIFFQKSIVSNLKAFKNYDIYVNPPIKGILSNKTLLSTLNNKANTFYKLYRYKSIDTKDLNTAFATFDLAVELIDSIRVGYRAESSKFIFVEKAGDMYDKAIKTAIELYEISSDSQHNQNAFIFSENSKSSVLFEALSDSKAKQFGGIPDQLLIKERDLRIDLAFYETQIQKLKKKKDQKDTDLITDFEARFFDLNREYEALIDRFEKEYPRYYDLKYQTRIASVSDIQKSLDTNTLMIEYFTGDSSLYIFTISKDEYDVFSLDIDSTFIPLLSNYYTSISKYDRKSFAEHSDQLYQILINPVEDKLKGKKKLLIIPDGMLYSIPFETLIRQATETDDFSKLDYLIKQYDISYHYSANLWLRGLKAAAPRKDDSFIAFAPVFSEQLKNGYVASRSTDVLDIAEIDINYLRSNSLTEEGNRKKFIPLPASEEEVRSIANLFNQKNSTADLYLHQEAKEEHLKTKAKDYRYVHIATHGWMDEERPKLSGLAFSQPTDSVFKEDGILYAGEMYNLDLNADLVILSACESGLGKLVKGEGPLSLTRGLLYSGARNIIISLWAVSDVHTSDLMVDLYQNILSGKSYPGALRAAKLKMIGNKDSAFPAKWSGFVLVGR